MFGIFSFPPMSRSTIRDALAGQRFYLCMYHTQTWINDFQYYLVKLMHFWGVKIKIFIFIFGNKNAAFDFLLALVTKLSLVLHSPFVKCDLPPSIVSSFMLGHLFTSTKPSVSWFQPQLSPKIDTSYFYRWKFSFCNICETCLILIFSCLKKLTPAIFTGIFKTVPT